MGIAEQLGFRPYTGGGMASPSKRPATEKAARVDEIAGLKRRVAEQDLEIARLKQELASRDERDGERDASRGETVTSRDERDARRQAAADRARRYRERKKASPSS